MPYSTPVGPTLPPLTTTTRFLLGLLLATLTTLLIPLSAIAQGWDLGAGLRVGESGGLSVAQRVAKRASVEGQLTTGLFTDGTTARVLLRRHVPVITKRVNVFVGVGAHKGWGYTDSDGEGRVLRGNPFGLDAQVGIDATLRRTNLAFDYLPQVDFSGTLGAFRFGAALTVRYVIDRRRINVSIRPPWRSKEDHEQRQRERQKRRRQREREQRRGERRPLRERLRVGSGS